MQVVAAVKLVVGIILENTQHIFRVDGAGAGGIVRRSNDYMNLILQQDIAVGSLNFSQHILVIFQTLDDDLAEAAIRGHGIEHGSIGFLGHMAGDIVHTFRVIAGGSDPITVGFVPDLELHMLEHPGVLGSFAVLVGEHLGQINAEGVHMGVGNEGVIVVGAGALPGQNHFIAVAILAIDEAGIGVDGGLVGQADGVVGIAHIHMAVYIGGSSVDLVQSSLGNIHGHMAVIAGIADGELAGVHIPGSYLVGAVLVGENLDLHAVRLVVAQTLRDGVIEVIHGQAGGIGGNGRQGADDLILQSVSGRSGCVVVETIGNHIGAVVAAGVLLCFTDGLFQAGDASLILGVHHHIIVPEVATLRGRGVGIAGNGGHGQGYEEGIGSGSHHFGNLGFHQQVQTHRQVADDSLAVFVGQGHSGAASLCHILFQSVLYGGGVGVQGISHGFVQSIGSVVIVGVIQLIGVVRIGVTASTVWQTDGGQQIRSLHLIEAIQHHGLVVFRVLVVGALRKGHDVGNPQVAEFHALNGIPVGVLAVAQSIVRRAIGIALTNTFAQDFFHIAFTPAGGDKGILIPDAVLQGVGPVKLPDGEAAVRVLMDGGIVNLGGKGQRSAAQTHDQCQTQGQNFTHFLHVVCPP